MNEHQEGSGTGTHAGTFTKERLKRLISLLHLNSFVPEPVPACVPDLLLTLLFLSWSENLLYL